jgi:Zn-dependent protease with chaperone function
MNDRSDRAVPDDDRPAGAAPVEDRPYQPLTAAERESFLDAIARHRRAAWQVNAVCALCVAVLAAVVALLVAPLWWALIGLVVDLANLVVPMPDLLGAVFGLLDRISDGTPQPSAGIAAVLALMVAPGAIAMGVVVFALDRLLRRSPWFDAGALTARPADRTLPAEQRLANVVEEMAIAAGVPPPRVLVRSMDVANAALFGRDDAHATLLVTEVLIRRASTGASSRGWPLTWSDRWSTATPASGSGWRW